MAKELSPEEYRISRVNCYDAYNPSSDDFDYYHRGYSDCLKIPPREPVVNADSVRSRESSLVLA